ncbi:C3 and PZP-like alpha-2-macroglobulin domain-containing protein 8 isoform X1 [Brienomyrus brachyistius]|uniref:C3 and PZP-like alpha-2-macroglobulin domain-containing protein 8 isoform X1 n=1 Tax=Brienomyrus brachyistius TaxID=42636 RepID=UPI0020B1BF54|nr:C3 and PZP-like alpha-2-macroglobulin domain-containing protein 8 isoform X1 [Brienomyrus brachyistius]XP_048833103.1 C3 and PZP-like alpha-2-macroglobulin domain-containing protein 8 isoform X1 [Brienomyrus brachyistius]
MKVAKFRRASWILSLTVSICIVTESYSQDRQGYLIAAPSVFRAGVEEALSVTIFNAVADTRVQVQLSVKGEAVAHSHGTVRDKGTIKLKVPPGLRGQAHLKVWGNRHLTEEGYIFHNHTTVTVDSKGTAVFIQTDKPVYRPRQKVLINVYSVMPNLRPANDKMDAYVVDPRGSRMIQWTDPKPLCCGIVNMSFPLSDQPVFGEWLIFVEMQGHTYNKSFEVQKYVMPKFELIIDPPRYIRDLNACEQAAVHARYTFGKPVVGKLTVNMTVNGVGYYRHELGHPVVKTMDIKGSVTFDLCVREMMPVDVADHFRGTVNIWASVNSVDGGRQTMFHDSTPVHKQLIDIKYSKDTRKQFKPGLPYKGKVEVTYPDGSPADGVKVRVKAELTPKDNVYASELTSRSGQAVFEIPSIPTAAQYVWLETKVTTIDGKPAGDQYLPNYLSISSWYSPSKCHIQLQSPSKPLQVGQEAEIALKSTCPCNFTLHYEIASRGNIVQSGKRLVNVTNHRAKRATVTFDKNIHTTLPPSGSASAASSAQTEADVCVSALAFTVTPAMTPFSWLLVYYVRENGEGVTDSLQIPVQPSFENQVSVSLSTNESMPGDPVSLRVKGEKGSCVCLAAVDKSLYLVKPGFRLSIDKVFRELVEFDVSDAFGAPKDDGHFWWPGLSSRRKRRSSVFPWHWDITKDARFAFTEAGLVVMTDLVSLNHRQSGDMYTDEAVPAFQPHTATLVASLPPRAVPRAEKRRRTFFPETWVWHCLNVSNVTGEAELQLDVPDSITTWVTEAIGLSEEKGLGLAQRAELRTFKPFFVDFTLPYSVIRGEQTKVPLTVYNYLPSCAEVYVKVSVPKGIKFVGHPGKNHLTRKKCVAAGEVTPTSIVLSFAELGASNITARAVAYSEPECCSDAFQATRPGRGPQETEDRSTAIGMDFVRRSVLVEPEGVPREYTYSVFFCPNERIHISTPNKYEYQYVKKPGHMTHFEVAVKTHNDAHFALSASPHDSAEMVEIVLGGRQNTRSWISLGKMGDPVASATTPGILSWDEFRSFWISWKGGVVQVGHGVQPSNETVIMHWAGPLLAQVRHVGFSTGWGSVGEFKIWRKEDVDENHNEAFTLGVPHNVVPGSERATASMIGDVMGPTLSNLDNLLRLPFGCGEQNMIHFAPNVFVLKYLQKTQQLSPEVAAEATDYLLQGYQRQLTYKRQDGSYSAFGERDSSGSMWLTAFVLKSFSQSRGFIFIDPEELQAAKAWLIRHQREGGSFPAMGRILNKDLQGGIHGKISLTAYVVTALLETGISTEEEKMALSKAKAFLEANAYSADDPYTAAVSAYALALLRSPYAPLALRRLNHMAITQDGFTHWSLTGSTVTDEDTFMGFSDGLFQSVVSAEVEMTAYALLTYTLLGDVASALPVVKWLSQQRNSLGGFSSTQDTCVALQALSEYAILSYIGGVNLTISLASTNLDFQETFELHRDNEKILQSAKIPSIPTGLFVSAKGEGCCLLQIDVSYSVPDPVLRPAFQLTVALKEPRTERHPPAASRSRTRSRVENLSELRRRRRAPADDEDPGAHQDHLDYRVTLEVCARWLHSGSSNMAVLEVPLLSGFRANLESLEKLLMDKRVGLKRYEVDGRKVVFYFDEIPSQCMTCVGFQAIREYIVGKTAPLAVKVYDYYEPAFEATRFYNVSENSPLARELCDGTTCNEVESSANQWIGFAQGNQCNNVFGCLEEEHFERCTCYRDCGYDGDPVCGSDGQLYQNQCQMEAAACRNGTRIEQMPLAQCPQKPATEEWQPVTRPMQVQEPEATQTGKEEHESLAEASDYFYEYGAESEPFPAEEDDGSRTERPHDSLLHPVDTKDTPER